MNTATALAALESCVHTPVGLAALEHVRQDLAGAAIQRQSLTQAAAETAARLGETEARLDALRTNLARLMKQIGEPGFCRGCGRPIYWVRHLTGNRAPYTDQGLNHFADCPQADMFRQPAIENRPGA